MINRHLVAVYGTLKRGQAAHSMLDDARFLFEDVTVDHFFMLDVGFPMICVPSKGFQGSIDLHPVLVEVYSVDTALLARLYKFESVGSLYMPEQIQLASGVTATMFVYYGGMQRWAKGTLDLVEPNEGGILDWSGDERTEAMITKEAAVG